MEVKVRKARPSEKLTLKDRLSRLTFLEACKLLGPEGKKLIQRNANSWDFKIEEDVHLGDDLFRLRFPGETVDGQPLTVTITLMAEAPQRLHWNCTRCDGTCEHVGSGVFADSRRQAPPRAGRAAQAPRGGRKPGGRGTHPPGDRRSGRAGEDRNR